MTRNYTYGTPGLNNVGSYQMTGLPYFSGSEALVEGQEERHTFPQVAKSVTVINHGAHALRVSFQATASMNTPETTHHFVTVSGAATPGGLTGSNEITLNGRMKDVFISQPYGGNTRYEIYAELTNIDSGEMLTLTGSGIST